MGSPESWEILAPEEKRALGAQLANPATVEQLVFLAYQGSRVQWVPLGSRDAMVPMVYQDFPVFLADLDRMDWMETLDLKDRLAILETEESIRSESKANLETMEDLEHRGAGVRPVDPEGLDNKEILDHPVPKDTLGPLEKKVVWAQEPPV